VVSSGSDAEVADDPALGGGGSYALVAVQALETHQLRATAAIRRSPFRRPRFDGVLNDHRSP